MAHRTDPFQTTGPLFGDKRQRVVDECNDLEHTLQTLDHELHELTQRRQHTALELRRRRRQLWPNLAKRARQPQPDGRRALPPITQHAIGLWGRRLRSACRDILHANTRPLSLVELHALLHRQGKYIACRHPVKALADAMRYDVTEGRLQRTARGIYTLR